MLMQKQPRLNHSKGWSTHQTLLLKALFSSKGPVLEVGGGLFSTPLLHWMCKSLDRKLVSCENDKEWFDIVVHNFVAPNHRTVFITDWEKELDLKTHWGLVFIDHHPNIRRALDVIRFKDTADYIVIHDTDYEGMNRRMRYDYARVWPNFKYIYHWKACRPWSSVVSNFYDVSKWDDNILHYERS